MTNVKVVWTIIALRGFFPPLLLLHHNPVRDLVNVIRLVLLVLLVLVFLFSFFFNKNTYCDHVGFYILFFFIMTFFFFFFSLDYFDFKLASYSSSSS